MPKIQDLTGQVFGTWKVLKKTNKKYQNGEILYKCQELNTNKIRNIRTSVLKQNKKCNQKYTEKGRPRKWTYKVNQNGFIIAKIPYKPVKNKK